jgi:hypothetical protein
MHKIFGTQKNYPKFSPQIHDFIHSEKTSKCGKNRVLHKVIHIIHIFGGKFEEEKRKGIKQMFCYFFLKWAFLSGIS